MENFVETMKVSDCHGMMSLSKVSEVTYLDILEWNKMPFFWQLIELVVMPMDSKPK